MIAATYTTYSLLELVHVCVAVVWVGGAATIGLIALRAARVSDPRELAGFARTAGWVGPTIFTPASLVVLLSGVGMMLEGRLPWDRGWILLSLAVWASSFVLGLVYFKPRGQRAGRLAAELGVDHPDVQRLLRQTFSVSRVVAVALLAVVALMSIKPAGLDLLALALAFGAAAVGVVVLGREGTAPGPGVAVGLPAADTGAAELSR